MFAVRFPLLSLVAVLVAVVLGYGLAFSRFDLLVVLAWAALALLTFRQMRGSALAVRRVWWWTLVLYPCWEFAIKWLVSRDVMPYSWLWLNRLEHFGWMAALLLLLLPSYQNAVRRRTALLFVLGLSCLIGNLNEIWEFGLRLWAGTAGSGGLYQDTLLDMITNLPGALLAYLIGSWVISPPVRPTRRPALRPAAGRPEP